MTLIKSISGIRGTIGGNVNDNLTPVDTVKFAAAYGSWLIKRNPTKEKLTVVLGRDARISGKMISSLVANTLVGLGIDVIDLGLSTTPTVEVAVPIEKTDGGIILTASHNPKQWNALKLLNEKGEFLNDEDGKLVLSIADNEDFLFADVDELGQVTHVDNYNERHIQEVLDLKLVDVEAIRKANFSVAIDAVNSVGGIVLPQLLKALGVENVIELYCEPNGHFPHNPEPLPEHLTAIADVMKEGKADVGFVVDPDVDRLAMVCEDGSMLTHTPGNTVSNMSSTRALADVTEMHKGCYTASAVGEVNVVSEMKAKNAIIGGEGNGGIIYPESHNGRDALVGIALFLTHLAKKGKKVSELRAEYPSYFISKNKIQLTPEIDVDAILVAMKEKYKNEKVNDIDGVKIDFAEEWVHLRKSNTEPIIRIYAESKDESKANALAEKIISEIKEVIA